VAGRDAASGRTVAGAEPARRRGDVEGPTAGFPPSEGSLKRGLPGSRSLQALRANSIVTVAGAPRTTNRLIPEPAYPAWLETLTL